MAVGIQLNMGLALWFALGGPSLQGHIVFLRHPMAGAAVHGTGTIKPTSNYERTVNIDLMVLVLCPVLFPIFNCCPWTSVLPSVWTVGTSPMSQAASQQIWLSCPWLVFSWILNLCSNAAWAGNVCVCVCGGGTPMEVIFLASYNISPLKMRLLKSNV